MLGWLKKRLAPVPETRDRPTGYTAMILAARESYISGVSGIAELTATVQACVSLWEPGFALADVIGTDLLDRRSMALLARALAFRGEAVFLIRDRLVPASDWEIATRNGEPRAYMIGITEAGGTRRETVLAPEVLHIRLAADPVAPWTGQAPLRRSSLSAQLLHEVESALTGVFRDTPLGSMIVRFEVAPQDGKQTTFDELSGELRGRRGRALLIEHAMQAEGGSNREPAHLTPPLRQAAAVETLAAARASICSAFGVLPALLDPGTTGPLVREAQRHLAGWTLQPIAALVAEEASTKLGGLIEIDVMRPLQAFAASGRARALATTMEALARTKDAGLVPGDVAAAMTMLNWGPGETAP